MRLLKCYGKSCAENNVKHPKEELINYKGKNYCKMHYNKKIKDDKDKKILTDYICKVYNMPYVSPFMLKQINDYIEDKGLTYDDIKGTLEYVSKLQGIELTSKYGLGIVLYKFPEYKEEKLRKETQQSIVAQESKNDIVTVQRNRLGNNLYAKEKIVDFGDDSSWLN